MRRAISNALRCDACGEDGGLGDLRKLEFVFRTFPAQLRDAVSERRVGFFEHLFSSGVTIGEVFAHANGLGALSGEEECDLFHEDGRL